MHLRTSFKLNTFIHAAVAVGEIRKEVAFERNALQDGGVSENAFRDVFVRRNLSCFYISMHCQNES